MAVIDASRVAPYRCLRVYLREGGWLDYALKLEFPDR